jgi:hypothetical protein
VFPRNANGSRRLAAAGAIARSVLAAEVAQARVFEGMLQAESAELHELAHRISGGGNQPDKDSSATSWELLQIHARLDEVQNLLEALRGRFPHQLPDS